MERHAYALDMAWPAILQGLGVRAVDVLRRAELSEDLFTRPVESLGSAEYFRFWAALEVEVGDGLPLRIYGALRAEAFSPPLFAALCSPNLLTALHRLSKYKRLVAPLRLDVVEEQGLVAARLTWLDRVLSPPVSLVMVELLFFVCLARLGTQERVAPVRIVTQRAPSPLKPYEEFVGCPIREGTEQTIVFARSDALRPFLSSNDSMWSIFEPALRKRIADLDEAATTAERVRAVLLEGLPGGDIALEAVAQRLALSKRTLQRRLEDEGTSFQQVLRETREVLAMHYLEQTRIPVVEISFLLGFDEPNSFFRAFGEWAGKTPETVRRQSEARRFGLIPG